MAYFAIYCLDKEGLESARNQARERHRAYLRTENEHGVETVLGGPLLDEEGRMNGTLLVVRAETLERARRFVADDPYSLSGLFRHVDIRRWAWGLGAPEHPSD